MTEPDTGSDVASMKTHAIDRGDHYELHGSKIWISNAHIGDAGLLYAYTDRDKGNKGISCFIIEPKNLEGCTARPIETKRDCIVLQPVSLSLQAHAFPGMPYSANLTTVSRCACGN